MSQYGLSARGRYSTISDTDLREAIRDILHFNSNMGEKSVKGAMKVRGIVVQRIRIRDAMYDVDPDSVQSCLRNVLHRRSYTLNFVVLQQHTISVSINLVCVWNTLLCDESV